MLNMKLSQILKLKFTVCRQLWNLSLDFPLSCTIFSYQNMEICTTVHIFDQRHDQTHANRPLKQATLDVEMWLYVANVIDDIKIIVDICSYLFNSLFIGKYLVISLVTETVTFTMTPFEVIKNFTSFIYINILWDWSSALIYPITHWR